MHQQQPARLLINDQTAFTTAFTKSLMLSLLISHLQRDVIAPHTWPGHLRTVVHKFIISKPLVQLRSSL